jgi:ParB-like chromosome segregation protein Spo0J
VTQVFRIGDIRPNPFRNIDRYPINREKVEKLKESIGRTDFWDNLVARIAPDGKPEIGYGHHRMVALRELYPDDHEVRLIVRDLDDAAMLHVMADENMQEWASTGAVIVETVRAVRDFLSISTPARKLGNAAKPNGKEDIVAFLGWPARRVEDALAIIHSEEAHEIEPEDTADLAIEQATVMRRHVAGIKNPVVKAKAIARVREDLREGRIGKRGIPEVVAQVRAEHSTNGKMPKVPLNVAIGIHRQIDGFFRTTVNVNGTTTTLIDLIGLIAENRDAAELQGVAGPIADQLADALQTMATQAERLASTLRDERMLVAGGQR